jgi:hypothetical protein
MYNFDEGVLELPSEWTDRSVNLFDKPVEGGSIALAITREVVPDDYTVEVATEEYLSSMMPRLRRFELISRAADKSLGVPGTRLRYRFFHAESGQATTIQLLLRWENRLVTVAMTGPGRAEEEMLRSFDAIVKTLKLRRRAG